MPRENEYAVYNTPRKTTKLEYIPATLGPVRRHELNIRLVSANIPKPKLTALGALS
jgi:hypothetical protein